MINRNPIPPRRGSAIISVPQAGNRFPMDEGVFTLTAEFFTEYDRCIRAAVVSPESRLSDHLNSSTPELDVQPFSVVQRASGAHMDLTGRLASLAKSRLIFVRPLSEPERPGGAANVRWRPTEPRRFWAGVGPYRLVGTIHTEAGRDPLTAIRLLDKQFLPVTDATLTLADGSVADFATVIINRSHLDFLALEAAI